MWPHHKMFSEPCGHITKCSANHVATSQNVQRTMWPHHKIRKTRNTEKKMAIHARPRNRSQGPIHPRIHPRHPSTHPFTSSIHPRPSTKKLHPHPHPSTVDGFFGKSALKKIRRVEQTVASCYAKFNPLVSHTLPFFFLSPPSPSVTR